MTRVAAARVAIVFMTHPTRFAEAGIVGCPVPKVSAVSSGREEENASRRMHRV